MTLAKRGAGRRPSGGRSGGGGRPIGEEIRSPPAPQGPPATQSVVSDGGVGRIKLMQEELLKSPRAKL